ncbi:MAG: polymer-forming cytoskeletal protein [Gammaproteobacteria bacterium]|nr:polymer-forming cytoskeletal protein [Gammaproteobacteria bacterium]
MIFQKRVTYMHIPAGSSLIGQINYDGEIQFFGEMHGDGNVQGHLQIGADGHWKGDINAARLTIEGKVHGNITVHEQLTLTESAVVRGNIMAPAISIQRGAVINGQLTMGKPRTVALLELQKSEELHNPTKQAAITAN